LAITPVSLQLPINKYIKIYYNIPKKWLTAAIFFQKINFNSSAASNPGTGDYALYPSLSTCSFSRGAKINPSV